jgi:hypothetical protein
MPTGQRLCRPAFRAPRDPPANPSESPARRCRLSGTFARPRRALAAVLALRLWAEADGQGDQSVVREHHPALWPGGDHPAGLEDRRVRPARAAEGAMAPGERRLRAGEREPDDIRHVAIRPGRAARRECEARLARPDGHRCGPGSRVSRRDCRRPRRRNRDRLGLEWRVTFACGEAVVRASPQRVVGVSGCALPRPGWVRGWRCRPSGAVWLVPE